MFKKLITLSISIGIMAWILSQIQWPLLLNHFRNADWFLAGFSLFLVAPQIILFSIRWQKIVSKTTPHKFTFRESLHANLACSALNLLFPSKLGEAAKALFLKPYQVPLKLGLHLVIFERYIDLLTLAWACLLGLFIVPVSNQIRMFFSIAAVALVLFPLLLNGLIQIPKIKHHFKITNPTGIEFWLAEIYQNSLIFLSHPWKNLGIISLSVCVWIVQIFQFQCFFLTFHTPMPWAACLGYVPLAIFAGLIPVSTVGIGTRDSALLYLFSGFAPREVIVSVGLIASIRYILPGLLGIVSLKQLSFRLSDFKKTQAQSPAECR